MTSYQNYRGILCETYFSITYEIDPTGKESTSVGFEQTATIDHIFTI